MKCPKCGKLLQSVFMGIASDFKNPIEIKDDDEQVIGWVVCINPDCADGRLNSNANIAEDIPF